MRSKRAPEDVLSLSYAWSSHKRARQNTLRVVFSNAAMGKTRSSVGRPYFFSMAFFTSFFDTDHFGPSLFLWFETFQFPATDISFRYLNVQLTHIHNIRSHRYFLYPSYIPSKNSSTVSVPNQYRSSPAKVLNGNRNGNVWVRYSSPFWYRSPF